MLRVGPVLVYAKRPVKFGSYPGRRLLPRSDVPLDDTSDTSSGYPIDRLNYNVNYRPKYNLPEDHPEYKSKEDMIESESELKRFNYLANKKDWKSINKEFPAFSSWRESWEHAQNESHKPGNYDDLAILDYERADDIYQWKMNNHLLHQKHPHDLDLMEQDLAKHRLHGIPSRDDPMLNEKFKWGLNVSDNLKTTEDFRNIHSLYQKPYTEPLDNKNESKWMEKQRNKAITSKSFGFRVDHDGKTNYNWQSIWPTQTSFKDSLVPFDVKAGAKLHRRGRPTKWNNTQLNFSPNLLHLTPPAIKAHCAGLAKLGTVFPKEYKLDYKRMRDDFPIEIHTISKCEGAPYQQQPGLDTRWATMYIQMSRLNLSESGRQKMKIFINGRENEGTTISRRKLDVKGKHNPKKITRRFWAQQDMRFGEDYYNSKTDMIKLESARCPLKHQNEGYLMYLLAAYYKDSSRRLKFENRGEVKNGFYSYDSSRAKQKIADLSKYHVMSEESENILGKAVEDLHNKESSALKLRGQDGYQRDTNYVAVGQLNCPKMRAMDIYSQQMKSFLLTEKQLESSAKNGNWPDYDEIRLEKIINERDHLGVPKINNPKFDASVILPKQPSLAQNHQ